MLCLTALILCAENQSTVAATTRIALSSGRYVRPKRESNQRGLGVPLPETATIDFMVLGMSNLVNGRPECRAALTPHPAAQYLAVKTKEKPALFAAGFCFVSTLGCRLRRRIESASCKDPLPSLTT